MQTYDQSTVVRAYDLGGFGDIAGAMRVASFLQRTGIPTTIKAKSESALRKLEVLNPDVEYGLDGTQNGNGVVLVDVAGHYGDSRNPLNRDVPHHFTEDMDNSRNRRGEVPIYFKTGLSMEVSHQTSVPVQFRGNGQKPMFYRPFREWDLPKPGERDFRKQIIQAFSDKKTPNVFRKLLPFTKPSGLARVLDETEKMGFAHLSPQIQGLSGETILEHPYFYSLHTAAVNFDSTFGLGLFVSGDLERKLTRAALQGHWGVVGSDGKVVKYDKDIPTLIFLGPQPQITTTGLFLSSNILNLVTGDLSLSDALYGLIAMEGPGFFYETPDWKIPTHTELYRFLSAHNSTLGNIYFVGGNYAHPKILKDQKELLAEVSREVIQIFGNPLNIDWYTEEMRNAVVREIRRRFGEASVEDSKGGISNGFYIPPGAPYLLQDATAKVVKTLREDPDTFSEVEDIRKAIAEGVPVTVNVQTGVLEPSPSTHTHSYGDHLGLEYLMDGKNLENIIENKSYFGLKKIIKEDYLNSIHISNGFENYENLEKIGKGLYKYSLI